MLRTLFAITLCLSSLMTNAQLDSIDTRGLRFGRVKGLAAEAERQGDVYLALEYYEKLIKSKPENYKLHFHIADLYRITKDYKNAEKHYMIVTEKALEKYPKAKFYLGFMQKSNGKPEEAKVTLTECKRMQREIADRNFKRLFRTELAGCDLAISLKDSNGIAAVEHMNDPINSQHIDFSPIPYENDKLVYGSLRVDDEQYYDQKEADTILLPKRKFYLAKKEDDQWNFEGEWSGPFNSDEEDVANGTFSLDSSRFYFTRCSKNWQYKMICRIYVAKKTSHGWSKPELMNAEINLEDFTSSHPTVGRESKRNQEVIYFVSDRPGGRGGMDIWYTEFHPRKQAFKTPRNVGGKVNSVGDEITPYYNAKTKTLYYSTDGRANIGGMDIYKTTGEKNKWVTSVHLGLPINSEADDVDFILGNDQKGGFLVSNRIGGKSLYSPTCCDDLYEFTYNDFIEITVSGQLIDVETKDCIDGPARVDVYIIDGEEKYLSEQVSITGCDYKLNLSPGFDYVLEPVKTGYYTGAGTITTKGISHSTDLKEDLELEIHPAEPIVLESIIYEFNSARLTKDSKNIIDTTLLVIMHNNPGIIIEILSHTDNKGSDEYNMELSQKRAESVVNYLLNHGISKSRLQANGYGETRPIAPNEHDDGTDDPVGRQKNRRTEFRILGTLDPTSPDYHPIGED